MNAAFTPGPWRWWTSNSWRRLTSEARDRNRPDGGVLCPITLRDGHPDCAVSEADMALIAAAPDLYEALYQCETVMMIVQPRSHTKEYLACLEQARLALAKASEKVSR
jgi:hypothetical protein